jgi:hypothetical protein
MNSKIPDFSAFPKTVRVGPEKSGVEFKLRPSHFALQHGGADTEPTEDHLPAEHIGIYPTQDYDQKVHGSQPVPVYSLGNSPGFAVPTGMVFVRLSPDLTIQDHTKDFADAGYEVAKTVAYAPNAVWLRAKSGKIADALTNTGKLNSVKGVENVEPQMLSKSVRKS